MAVKRQRQKKGKPPEDVKSGFRRWGGWRGMYSDVKELHGPVIVRSALTSPGVSDAEAPSGRSDSGR